MMDVDAEADRSLNIVGQRLSRAANREMTVRPIDKGVLKMFTRCRSALESIQILLQGGHPKSAGHRKGSIYRLTAVAKASQRAGESRWLFC